MSKTNTTSSPRSPLLPARYRYRAVSLVEITMAIALGAVLLTAVGSGLSAMLNNLRGNQAQIQGLRSARVAMEYLTAQLRQADGCDMLGTTGSSGDANYPYQASEICVNFVGADRAGHAATPNDYLGVHVSTDLGSGKTGLRIWKNTILNGQTLSWSGQTYTSTSSSGYFDVPNVSSASIYLHKNAGNLVDGAMIQITLQVADQNGQLISVPLTGTVALRRAGGF